MALFTPGQFKKSLQEKVKGETEESASIETPVQIKKVGKVGQESMYEQTATYAAEQQRQRMQQSSSQGTASLPKESPMNMSIHDRMKFVKEQMGK